jgi:hypothetical protein
MKGTLYEGYFTGKVVYIKGSLMKGTLYEGYFI